MSTHPSFDPISSILFLLCHLLCFQIGDEHSDDIMFEAMIDTIADSHCPARLRDLRTFTVCVGRRETPADYYINEVKDVEHLLTKLADSPTTETTSASQR